MCDTGRSVSSNLVVCCLYENGNRVAGNVLPVTKQVVFVRNEIN